MWFGESWSGSRLRDREWEKKTRGKGWISVRAEERSKQRAGVEIDVSTFPPGKTTGGVCKQYNPICSSQNNKQGTKQKINMKISQNGDLVGSNNRRYQM
jgi:hypothetical protein